MADDLVEPSEIVCGKELVACDYLKKLERLIYLFSVWQGVGAFAIFYDRSFPNDWLCNRIHIGPSRIVFNL